MEQLNIEGRRSGAGFVCHRDRLLQALSVSQAERLEVMDYFIGRRGFLSYLKALGGSNVVKVVPWSGKREGKGLKVAVGTNEGFVPDGAWIKSKAPLTVCQARVSPENGIVPNLSGFELAQALERTLPFAETDDQAPAFSKVVHFRLKDGKLSVVVTTRFRIAEVTIGGMEGEGSATVSASELGSLTSALRKAKRARLSLVENGLVLDTELVRYKFPVLDMAYPDWPSLIPGDMGVQAYFDTREATRASQSLGSVWISDSLKAQYNTLILVVADNRLTLMAEGNHSQAYLPADTEGEAVIALQARYLTQALKACGGMVSLKVKDEESPMLFETEGYRLLVMPMTQVPEVAQVKAQRAEVSPGKGETAKAEGEQGAGEHKAVTEAKSRPPKRKAKAEPKEREPVTVAS